MVIVRVLMAIAAAIWLARAVGWAFGWEIDQDSAALGALVAGICMAYIAIEEEA